MKKLWILFLMILLCGITIGHASALTDAAKQEKARRAALHLEGKKVKVFTNADIDNLKSTLAFSVTSEPSEIEETPAPEQKAQPQTEQNNEEKEALKQEREELQQKAQEAQDTINQGGGYFTRNIGDQFRAMREAQQRIHEIDDRLKKTEKGENGESENQEAEEEQPPQ